MFGMRGSSEPIHHRARGFVGIRFWILNLISKKEMTGAEIMERIEELSMGMWRPSPGSVYPILKDLEREGYVKAREDLNKRYYSLTQKGSSILEEMLWLPRQRFRAFERVDDVRDTIDWMDGFADFLKENEEKLKSDAELYRRFKEIKEKLNTI
ncbi:MAG: helix-turn-helix transcriptional regulator [Thermoplasmata archaeon]